MKNIFTLISHTPGEDSFYSRCGDYTPGKPSELNISYSDNLEEASTIFAQYSFNNPDGENLCLYNGIDLYNFDNIIQDENLKSIYENIFNQFDNLSFNKRLELERLDKIKKEQEKIDKINLENLKKLKEKQRIEQEEKLQLSLLLKKYGNK